MKNFQNIAKYLTRGPVLGLVAAWGLLLSGLPAQEKGAERLLKLHRPDAVADVQPVKPGDKAVKCCPKCKDTWVTVVEKTGKAAHPQEQKRVQRHECPGCQTRIVTDGLAKPPRDKVVHTCKNCGRSDAFCSAATPEAGPTKEKNEPQGHSH